MKTKLKAPADYKTVNLLLDAICTWSKMGCFNSWQYYFAKASLIETFGWKVEEANLYCKKKFSCTAAK